MFWLCILPNITLANISSFTVLMQLELIAQLPSVPSATQVRIILSIKLVRKVPRPASSVDNDGEDAIASSGNNGDRLMEKQKPKCGVFLRGYSVNLVT